MRMGLSAGFEGFGGRGCTEGSGFRVKNVSGVKPTSVAALGIWDSCWILRVCRSEKILGSLWANESLCLAEQGRASSINCSWLTQRGMLSIITETTLEPRGTLKPRSFPCRERSSAARSPKLKSPEP